MDDLFSNEEKITLGFSNKLKIEVYLKREDLLHPEVSGNKWRKLKYNIKEVKKLEGGKILTFGGAFSNHLAAVAAAGRMHKIETIGIVRGEEIMPKNYMLAKASEDGMTLFHVSRSEYKKKHTAEFCHFLKNLFGEFFLIPEGGANKWGVMGCAEILTPKNGYDCVACPVGTGTTAAGILLKLEPFQKLICYPALKGGAFLRSEIRACLKWFLDEQEIEAKMKQLVLITDYHFGGFGKVTAKLIDFMKKFYFENNIYLDPLYTSKMLYGLMQMINEDYFSENSKILAIHTGGLQGIKGIEERLGKRIF